MSARNAAADAKDKDPAVQPLPRAFARRCPKLFWIKRLRLKVFGGMTLKTTVGKETAPS
jgi:hypothetical protein